MIVIIKEEIQLMILIIKEGIVIHSLFQPYLGLLPFSTRQLIIVIIKKDIQLMILIIKEDFLFSFPHLTRHPHIGFCLFFLF